MLLIDWKTAPDETTVCYCGDIDLGTIKRAIEDGAKSLLDIQDMTRACTGGNCEELNPSGGCCETDIMKILHTFCEDMQVRRPGPKPLKLKRKPINRGGTD